MRAKNTKRFCKFLRNHKIKAKNHHLKIEAAAQALFNGIKAKITKIKQIIIKFKLTNYINKKMKIFRNHKRVLKSINHHRNQAAHLKAKVKAQA